jgi:hypothetical protein
MPRWRFLLRGPIVRLVEWAEPFTSGGRWCLAAVAVGVVPLTVAFLGGLPGQQLLSGILLAWLTLACVGRDAWVKGCALIVLAFLAHSATAIALAKEFPEAAAQVMPDGANYWNKQIHWIQTGQDPEYHWQAWVPAHLQLLGGASLFSFSSLGTVTFWQGFHEVDMMNYYDGRLMAASTNPWTTLGLGWHLWSLLRGLGFVFITLEVVSLAVVCFTGLKLSTFRTRVTRWSLGLGFLAADMVAKSLMTEPVRQKLFENLI